MQNRPIGVFDSGVGGLTVLRELRLQLPAEQWLYFADQAHVPYGPRSMEEVRRFCFGIVDFLLSRGAKMIVVACNTASAAALKPLREAHPQIPFIGMEPAIKPAARESRRGVIGVIATPATFQGELFASVVDRYARDVRILTRTCPGLVERIEAGEVDGPELESMLREQLDPLLREGIDELVLGCTHYPFAKDALEKVVGAGVRIIDPAPAVARQTGRVLAHKGLAASPGMGSVAYFTSGPAEMLSRILERLLKEEAVVHHVEWSGNEIVDGKDA